MLLKKLKIFCGEVDDLRRNDGFQRSKIKFSRISNYEDKCWGCIFGSFGKDCGQLEFRYSNEHIAFISSICMSSICNMGKNKRYILKEIEYVI